jgi:DNA-binding NarL/FixJ family response regulator
MADTVRLLVADDSEPIRRAIRSLLDAEPTITVVAEAGSYAELVSKLDESNAEVVFMDVHMQGLSQLDAFKGRLSGLCILAMSFWTNEETGSLAASFGAVKLLDKTKLGSEIDPAVKECIRETRTSNSKRN